LIGVSVSLEADWIMISSLSISLGISLLFYFDLLCLNLDPLPLNKSLTAGIITMGSQSGGLGRSWSPGVAAYPAKLLWKSLSCSVLVSPNLLPSETNFRQMRAIFKPTH
jgi:hypothetical protein